MVERPAEVVLDFYLVVPALCAIFPVSRQEGHRLVGNELSIGDLKTRLEIYLSYEMMTIVALPVRRATQRRNRDTERNHGILWAVIVRHEQIN